MSTFDAASVTAGRTYAKSDRSAGFTRWTIGNADLTCTLGWLDDRVLQFETIERTDNLGVVVRSSREVFAITIDDLHRLTAESMTVSGVETASGDEWVQLRVHLASEGHGSIAFVLELRERHPVLRQWLEYAADGAVTITRCDPWLLTFADPGSMLLKTVAGVQQQGGWAPESGVYRSFRIEERDPAEGTVIQSGLRSTWDECPWVAVVPRDGSGGLPGGALVAFDYGGQWELSATPEQEGGSFTLGFAACVHQPSLSEGAGWTSPATWVSAFPDDLDAGSRIWIDYLRDSVIPEQPSDFPWVQFNTWYSHYCDLDAAELLEQAAIAADLGVEVFYVDAGWWESNPRRKWNFASGLGTWRENREKFPDGIAAFADGIRNLGMHFGIWAEPERVDLRTATTARWKPEWLATAHGDYLGPEWPADTQTAWLCFGHPETQAWATHTLGDMIAAFGVRWLKWDSNFWGVCTNPNHGHGMGDGERAQLEGVYTVMDALRQRFPDLVIENCAGGGTRMDFSIARHTHTWWLDDASEPSHRTRLHSSGAGYLFPMETNNSWVTESAYENLNGQDLPDPVVRAVFRARMMGAIGISCQLTTWSTFTRDIVREELAFYKETLRPIVRTGHLLHLLPQPDLQNPHLAPPPSWEAFQLRAPDGSTSAVFGFRNVSSDAAQRVFLKGLEAEAMYRLTAEDGTTWTASGADLMELGIDLACTPLCSVRIVVRATGEAASTGA